MGQPTVAKVTISLPQHLLDLADRLAREGGTTRSAVICELLEKEEKARVQALMAEGYQEMAEENRRLAQEAFPLTSETVLRDTRWDEPTDG